MCARVLVASRLSRRVWKSVLLSGVLLMAVLTVWAWLWGRGDNA